MTATVTITGQKELDRKLRALPGKVQLKLEGQAIRAGLRVIAKAVRSQAHPAFKKSVGSRYTRKKGGMVGVNVGKKKGRGYAPHFSLYVLGTGNRTTRDEYNRGESPSHPIVDVATLGTRDAALKATAENLAKGIEREAARS